MVFCYFSGKYYLIYRKMKKLVLAVAFLSVTSFGFAQSNDFKQDVLKMIEVSGGNAAQEQMIEKQLVPMVAEDKRADFKKDVQAVFAKINGEIADYYMTKFSHAEVKELLEFYNSPIGKKLSEATPEVTAKSMEIGQSKQMELQQVMMKYMQ